ncbi:MAG TPA: hypothetical protein VF715_15750 [Thermoleophilaceae bacterium]
MLYDLTPHRVIAEALEREVKNRDWFVWLSVDGNQTPEAPDLATLAQETERWLSRWNPDRDRQPPEFEWLRPGVSVRLRALPKKKHARGANPLVGNPHPAFAQWA